MFYGIKTRKAYTRVKKGKNYTYELFYVLKKPQDPMPYVKDIYWFHRKKRKIFVGPIPEKEKEHAKILHGPYLKQINRDIVEEGIFYLGAKHGRWMYEKPVGEESILQDKQKFYKGFPKESEVAYYDVEKTKLKEVLPIEDGQYHGNYVRYYESGVLAEEGKYEYGVKIGMWVEYYDSQKKIIKKQTQYAKSWEVSDFEPYVVREYNDKGRVTYDKATEDKKKAAEEAKKPAKN
jgi:antitoxin component YwqK of YwqJK toxin-antitoxin module